MRAAPPVKSLTLARAASAHRLEFARRTVWNDCGTTPRGGDLRRVSELEALDGELRDLRERAPREVFAQRARVERRLAVRLVVLRGPRQKDLFHELREEHPLAVAAVARPKPRKRGAYYHLARQFQPPALPLARGPLVNRRALVSRLAAGAALRERIFVRRALRPLAD